MRTTPSSIQTREFSFPDLSLTLWSLPFLEKSRLRRKRILRLCGRDVYYLQTANSRYRLEVRSGDPVALEAPVAR